jgi:TonB family protein
VAPDVTESGMVQTDPAGALVSINNQEIGRSPVPIGDLGPGEHRLQVQLPGYAPIDFSFPVTARMPARGFSFNLSPLSAPMRVQSDPPGALITVDGVRLGATPLANVPLSPGRHEIRIELKGYKPFVQSVIAHAGQRVSLNPRLSVLAAADAQEIAAAAPAPALPLATPVPVFEGMFVPLADVDRLPRRIQGDYAKVPESAKKRKGTVEVEMIVTEAGYPTGINVTQSAGPDLDEAVRRAVSEWKFEPARKGGINVRTRYVLRSEFR